MKTLTLTLIIAALIVNSLAVMSFLYENGASWVRWSNLFSVGFFAYIIRARQ